MTSQQVISGENEIRSSLDKSSSRVVKGVGIVSASGLEPVQDSQNVLRHIVHVGSSDEILATNCLDHIDLRVGVVRVLDVLHCDNHILHGTVFVIEIPENKRPVLQY